MLHALAEEVPALQKKLTVEPLPNDPAHLNDEVATGTEWGPAVGHPRGSRAMVVVRLRAGAIEFADVKDPPTALPPP